MKKFVLSLCLVFLTYGLTAQIILAPENPCPTISNVQIITTSTSGGNCTKVVQLRIQNDVSTANPKMVRVEVLNDGVNVSSTDCFLASTVVGGSVFTTTPTTASCTATPLVRITRFTASNGECQGGTCGEIILVTPISITGAVNCTNPRTYNLFIDAKHESPVGTPAIIMGTYETFIDKNPDGVIDAEEEANYKITAATAFSTTLGGALTGYNSRFIGLNLPYNNGVVVGAGALSSASIIIRVFVTTTGVSGNENVFANTCGTLPISLRNFNAAQRNGKVALTWETDQENNNDGFEVQRRLGNGKYETIAFVDSKAPAGTGGAYAYSFDDQLAASNTVAYYRLRQVDLDGRSGYSEIRSVRNGSKQISVSVYPNPSRGTANVAIPDGVGMMDISLNDLSGKSVQRWNSVNVRNLQLNNLKPGIYMLRINFRETGDQVVERIVVQ